MSTARKLVLLSCLVLLAAVAACGNGPPGPAKAPPKPTATEAATAPPEAPPPRADATLLPRKVLFGNPDRTVVKISRDGKRISWVSAHNGILNVFVAPADDPAAAKPVTNDTKRGIYRYFWAYDNQHLIYQRDQGGDENWRVYAVHLDSGQVKDLTPIEGIQARIVEVSHKHPNEILVGINDRDKKLHDIYRVDLRTGERKLLQKNEEGFLGFMADYDYRIRLAIRMLPTGGMELLEPAGQDKWKPFTKIEAADVLTTSPVGFDLKGKNLYLIDSRGRDLAALTTVELASGKQQVLAQDDKADIADVVIHPKKMSIQAATATYDRLRWHVLDKELEADLAALGKAAAGDVEITSRSFDNQRWLVAFTVDNGPIRYYLYDRADKQARFLFSHRQALESLKLVKMHPVVIKARDGLPLVSYLSLPAAADPDGDGKANQAVPLTLYVHGGPWSRDSWGYDSWHQWLASRGYAVLSVNYRGSTGFGKAFINAADKQWAGKMHDDLIDAVDWAIKEGIADEKKVAIMGGSYGGYATLVGLTFTPQKFACGVDVVGPSSLVTLLQNVPPYWAPMMPLLTTRVGDHQTEQGRAFLLERSPLSRVDKIERPLLIGQGKNDPRVKQSEADQIVKAMQQKSIPVTYALYPDEGHGFLRAENRTSFNAIAEVFLAQCLGGVYQPMGDDLKGASLQVPAGADRIYGLSELLKK